MQHFKLTLPVAVVLLWFASVSATAQGLSLEQILTKDEQAGLGLPSMTLEQRTALSNVLIRIYRQGFAVGQSRGAGAGLGGASAIEAQVDGTFNGWEGETIVKLTNGQIWQQIEYFYEYHYAYMPNVIIYSSGGTYKMKVDGTSRAVGVRQLR